MVSFTLAYIVPFFVLYPLVLGLMGYRFYAPAQKILVWYLVISAVSSVVGIYLAKNHINNMPLFHAFTLVEFLMLVLFYKSLENNQIKRKFYSSLIVAFSLFVIVNAIYFQPLQTYNSIPRSVESLLLIGISIYSLFQNFGHQDLDHEKSIAPIVWINSGIILYFSGALFLFLFTEYLAQEPAYYRLAWLLHAILLAAFLYVMIGIYLNKTKIRK